MLVCIFVGFFFFFLASFSSFWFVGSYSLFNSFFSNFVIWVFYSYIVVCANVVRGLQFGRVSTSSCKLISSVSFGNEKWGFF
jgi:hypothetical protein